MGLAYNNDFFSKMDACHFCVVIKLELLNVPPLGILMIRHRCNLMMFFGMEL